MSSINLSVDIPGQQFYPTPRPTENTSNIFCYNWISNISINKGFNEITYRAVVSRPNIIWLVYIKVSSLFRGLSICSEISSNTLHLARSAQQHSRNAVYLVQLCMRMNSHSLSIHFCSTKTNLWESQMPEVRLQLCSSDFLHATRPMMLPAPCVKSQQ